MDERVTVAIINYNGKEYLKDEIESIIASDYPNVSVLLADDCSTDGSVEFVKKHFPKVNIHRMDYNKRLYGRHPLANRVRNEVLRKADTRLVFLLDNDITLAKDCISKLVETMNALEDCAVCTPRVMYKEYPDTIYSDGAILHYVGTSMVRNRDTKLSGNPEAPKYSLGCGIQMVDRNLAEKVDFTDDHFVIGWGDDGEFHHRMNIAGYRCYNVPQAKVYHPKKDAKFVTVAHVKNRWWILLTSYAFSTLLLAFPALLVYELALLLFVLIKGDIKAYFLSAHDTLIHFMTIMRKRKKIQSMRVVPDRELIESGDVFTASKHVGNHPVLRLSLSVLNSFFHIYWLMIKRWL